MSAEVFKAFNLLLANLGVVDFKNVDRSFLLEAILVYANDSLLARVDACLSAGSRLLDAHLRNTGLDSLSHTAKFLDFLQVSPSLLGNLVGERLYIVRTCPWVDFLADVGLFLDVYLSVTCDTG